MNRTLLAIAAAACLGAAEQNLVANGGFDQAFTGWEERDGASIVDGDGGRHLQVRAGVAVPLRQAIAVDPTWRSLTVAARMRVGGFAMGPESWSKVRIACVFVLADGGKSYPAMPEVDHDTDGWVEVRVEQLIPAGAVRFEAECANFGSAGRAEFDDVRIVPHR